MLILGIESSCDDTSLALYDDVQGVVGVYTAGQLVHDRYGGVVPEIASREHVRSILTVFEQLLAETGTPRVNIDGIAVSNGPGLVGSLLVGVGFARGLAVGLGRPVVGVHHIEAHILSNELDGEPMRHPCVVLVVSGGHTQLFHIPEPREYRLAGSTRDDAAGEAFDKIAKLLGLGFPGGPAVEEAAQEGNPAAVEFPRALRGQGNLEFSFSGLKTAVRQFVDQRSAAAVEVADVAASAQRAIVDVLVSKTIACAESFDVKHVYIAGGVASNSVLRRDLQKACAQRGMSWHAPLLQFCTDNGAMVARAGCTLLRAGRDDGGRLDVFARGTLAPAQDSS